MVRLCVIHARRIRSIGRYPVQTWVKDCLSFASMLLHQMTRSPSCGPAFPPSQQEEPSSGALDKKKTRKKQTKSKQKAKQTTQATRSRRTTSVTFPPSFANPSKFHTRSGSWPCRSPAKRALLCYIVHRSTRSRHATRSRSGGEGVRVLYGNYYFEFARSCTTHVFAFATLEQQQPYTCDGVSENQTLPIYVARSSIEIHTDSTVLAGNAGLPMDSRQSHRTTH